jgi:hypothetical protein
VSADWVVHLHCGRLPQMTKIQIFLSSSHDHVTSIRKIIMSTSNDFVCTHCYCYLVSRFLIFWLACVFIISLCSSLCMSISQNHSETQCEVVTRGHQIFVLFDFLLPIMSIWWPCKYLRCALSKQSLRTHQILVVSLVKKGPVCSAGYLIW